jgi:hypothetical protein
VRKLLDPQILQLWREEFLLGQDHATVMLVLVTRIHLEAFFLGIPKLDMKRWTVNINDGSQKLPFAEFCRPCEWILYKL